MAEWSWSPVQWFLAVPHVASDGGGSAAGIAFGLAPRWTSTTVRSDNAYRLAGSALVDVGGLLSNKMKMKLRHYELSNLHIFLIANFSNAGYDLPGNSASTSEPHQAKSSTLNIQKFILNPLPYVGAEHNVGEVTFLLLTEKSISCIKSIFKRHKATQDVLRWKNFCASTLATNLRNRLTDELTFTRFQLSTRTFLPPKLNQTYENWLSRYQHKKKSFQQWKRKIFFLFAWRGKWAFSWMNFRFYESKIYVALGTCAGCDFYSLNCCLFIHLFYSFYKTTVRAPDLCDRKMRKSCKFLFGVLKATKNFG